jgi:ubiquinone biosynthesis protein
MAAMSWLQKPKQIGATIKNAGRLRKIVSVFARNGFQDVAQRIKLNSFISSWGPSSETSHLSTAQRVRISFEELGPTFIKLGQLLASRPDIIPADYVIEFRKLQDQIPPIPFSEIEEILDQQYPSGYKNLFREFLAQPIGSASIAQVHRARLQDGTSVVVKIQKPGISEIIEDDIRILHLLADLCEQYIPESRIFNPSGMVNEFARSISLETNFVVEANNIKRFQENFVDFPEVKIPNIYLQHCGSKILVMEELKGLPMSHPQAFQNADMDRSNFMQVGMKAYFSMVFRDGLFHGDLHAGNIFVLPENRIGFIDFGMVGRLSRRTQRAIAAMFMALLAEDYDRLAYEYIELAPFNNQTSRQSLAQDLRSILSPFFGLTLKDVNMGKLLLESSKVAAKHHVVLPSELMMFFKSMVTIEGLARMVQEDFDLLPFIKQYAKELLKTKVTTTELFSDATFQIKEWASFLESVPKEIKTHLRKINQPDYRERVEIQNLQEVQKTIYQTGRLVFVGLVIASLIIAGAMTVEIDSASLVYGVPVFSMSLFGLATLLFIRFFLKGK